MANISSNKTSGKASTNFANLVQAMNFPANKQNLIKQAKQKGADQSTFDIFNNLPNKTFTSLADLMKETGTA